MNSSGMKSPEKQILLQFACGFSLSVGLIVHNLG